MRRSGDWALVTAGILIKGPIIYAFLVPGIVVAALYERRPAVADRRYRIWFGWWPWLASLAIFFVWVIAGWLWVPRFYELVIVREFLARFGEIGSHVHRTQPLWFYFPHLLYKFLPWSVLMVGLAFVTLRVRKLDRLNRSSSQGASEIEKVSPETVWLICWSFGGLILMSLIPSKRVDRIFPIIPPLCLLVAVQTAHFLKGEQHRARNFRWIAATLIFAVLFSVGYAATRIVSGYREHRNALSIFGRQVRKEAAKNHWRYEAVGSTDEGLPLYLTRPHFLKPEDAVAKWNSGEINALAVPANQAPQLMRELHDSTRRFESPQRRNLKRPNYVLLTH